VLIRRNSTASVVSLSLSPSLSLSLSLWQLLFRGNGRDYDPRLNSRIEDLIDLKILRVENFEVFLSIDKDATREQKLKEELAAMQTWLNELISRMIKYGAAHKPTTTTTSTTNCFFPRSIRV
jgi:hypothetical protein